MEDDRSRTPPDDRADLLALRTELRRREHEPVVPERPGFVEGAHQIDAHDIDHLPTDVELGNADDPSHVSGDVTPQVEREDEP